MKEKRHKIKKIVQAIFFLSRLFFYVFFSFVSFFFRIFYYGLDHFERLEHLEHLKHFEHFAHFEHHLIIDSCASPSDNLISISYSMPAFSANSFGLFFITESSCQPTKIFRRQPWGMTFAEKTIISLKRNATFIILVKMPRSGIYLVTLYK